MHCKMDQADFILGSLVMPYLDTVSKIKLRPVSKFCREESDSYDPVRHLLMIADFNGAAEDCLKRWQLIKFTRWFSSPLQQDIDDLVEALHNCIYGGVPYSITTNDCCCPPEFREDYMEHGVKVPMEMMIKGQQLYNNVQHAEESLDSYLSESDVAE